MVYPSKGGGEKKKKKKLNMINLETVGNKDRNNCSFVIAISTLLMEEPRSWSISQASAVKNWVYKMVEKLTLHSVWQWTTIKFFCSVFCRISFLLLNRKASTCQATYLRMDCGKGIILVTLEGLTK